MPAFNPRYALAAPGRRHHQPQQDRAKGELALVGVIRHVGPEFLSDSGGVIVISTSLYHSTLCRPRSCRPAGLARPSSPGPSAWAKSRRSRPALRRRRLDLLLRSSRGQVAFDERALGLFLFRLLHRAGLAEASAASVRCLINVFSSCISAAWSTGWGESTFCFNERGLHHAKRAEPCFVRLFMAATMACETWSIKGIMSDILVD